MTGPVSPPVTGPIIFLGTGPVAIPTLEALAASSEDLVLVVTQPDRPRARGRKLKPTPVKETALRLGLRVITPENINAPETVAELCAHEPEFLVLVDYGQLLKTPILEVSLRGPVNLHPSLLPRHRGPAPVVWTLLSCDALAGATTMFMDQGMDTGDLLMQQSYEVAKRMTCGELTEELATMGARLILDTLAGVRSGELTPRRQDGSQATYSRKIDRDLCTLDWNTPAKELAGLINALSPQPGARGWLEHKMVKPLRAELVESDAGSLNSATPGEIIAIDREGLVVATSQGALRILDVLPEGRKMMSADAFARGGGARVGMVFGAA
jgi:methionyl-tRNA formyltransferase